jgi:hypothetical protein
VGSTPSKSSKRSSSDFRVGTRVYDSWWPYRLGKVVRVTKTTVHVKWADTGFKWVYDRAHMKWLKKSV